MTDTELFIWRVMARSFYFDEGCHQALVDGRVTCFTYLSSGQESIAAAVAAAFHGIKVNVFPQHRNHDSFISFGGDPKAIRDELLGLPSGTTGGIGGDPCHAFKSDRVNYVGHIGFIGDQVPIGVGMAFATKEWSVIFCGDSSCEEDCFWPAVGFAVTHNLPVLFVEADNGLSVITEVSKRRSWHSDKVAFAYGCAAYNVDDNPLLIHQIVTHALKKQHPSYIRVATNRRYKHVGHGLNDVPMKWDRMSLYRDVMYNKYSDRARKIESDAQIEMSQLWQR